MTRELVALGIESSLEFRADEVQALDQQYLHRPADSTGLVGFTGFLMNGGTVEQVAAMLAGSSEFFQQQAQRTDAGFVQALFQDALHRPASMAKRQKLVFGLTLVSRQEAAAMLLRTSEHETDLVLGDYTQYLRRSAAMTEAGGWVAALRAGLTDEQVIAGMIGSEEYFHLV